MARSGLESSNIDQEDIDRYLGIVEKRVETKKTGAQWFHHSLAAMKGRHGSCEDCRVQIGVHP